MSPLIYSESSFIYPFFSKRLYNTYRETEPKGIYKTYSYSAEVDPLMYIGFARQYRFQMFVKKPKRTMHSRIKSKYASFVIIYTLYINDITVAVYTEPALTQIYYHQRCT